jgi:hypothetical protein
MSDEDNVVTPVADHDVTWSTDGFVGGAA